MTGRTTVPGQTPEQLFNEYRYYSSRRPLLYNPLLDGAQPRGRRPGDLTRLVHGELIPVTDHEGHQLAKRCADLHDQFLATATMDDEEEGEEAAGKNKKTKGKRVTKTTKAPTGKTKPSTTTPQPKHPTLHIPLPAFLEYTSLLHDLLTPAQPHDDVNPQPTDEAATANMLFSEPLLTAQLLAVWRQGYAAAHDALTHPPPAPCIHQQQHQHHHHHHHQQQPQQHFRTLTARRLWAQTQLDSARARLAAMAGDATTTGAAAGPVPDADGTAPTADTGSSANTPVIPPAAAAARHRGRAGWARARGLVPLRGALGGASSGRGAGDVEEEEEAGNGGVVEEWFDLARAAGEEVEEKGGRGGVMVGVCGL
ncbi:hypothetical protein C8A05DRAFT_37977 [Staphylotrichum tortipilum]|uniref:Uncharacterized protein n=1 Tax=Staphylotrichum tortipilum TaxID=2831512 RepID=A0AAN6MDF5_9PEZI|nr:hypothetical protein C8A05DRAFT_37977 [Staphylotrichum longicolle]